MHNVTIAEGLPYLCSDPATLEGLLGGGDARLHVGKFIFHLHGVIGTRQGFVLHPDQYDVQGAFAEEMGAVMTQYSLLTVGVGELPALRAAAAYTMFGSCWRSSYGISQVVSALQLVFMCDNCCLTLNALVWWA